MREARAEVHRGMSASQALNPPRHHRLPGAGTGATGAQVAQVVAAA